MTKKVGISGFGRIGRAVARNIFQNPWGLEVVAVNDLSDAATLAHLFKYDSTMGKWAGSIMVDGNTMVINGKPVKVLAVKEPKQLPWRDMGVDIVLESTGVFTERESARGGYGDHIVAGAKRVVLSAPAKDDYAVTVVLGVNDNILDPNMFFVSNASCTTNCLAPLAKVLHEAFVIERGMMTTIHAYTNDQRILDLVHKDLRRARAAALNLLITTTGAAKSIGKVIPALEGKLDGISVRAPVPCGSLVDLSVEFNREVTREEINAAVKSAAYGRMLGIIEYCEDPIASSDIKNNPASCVFDSLATMVLGKKSRTAKVFSWYDNEWAYSCRTVELMSKMAGMM